MARSIPNSLHPARVWLHHARRLAFAAGALFLATTFAPTPAAAQIVAPTIDNIEARTMAGTSVTITYTESTTASTTHRIRYRTRNTGSGAGPWLQADGTNDATDCAVNPPTAACGSSLTAGGTMTTIMGLTTGVTYEFNIGAGTSAGFSWPPASSATPLSTTVPLDISVIPKEMTSDTVTLTWMNSTSAGAAHYVRWRVTGTTSPLVGAGAWHSSHGQDNVDCIAAVPTDCGEDLTTNNGGYEITGLMPSTDYDFAVVAVASGTATEWQGVRRATRSNIPTLSGISISGFQDVVDLFLTDRTQTSYTAFAGSAVASTDVLAVPNGFTANARIGSGATAAAAKTAAEATAGSSRESLTVTLTAGATTHIAIVATAEDGTTKITYNFAITKAAATDDTLRELTVEEGTFTPAFTAGATTTQYAVAVPATRFRAGLMATPTDNSASVSFAPAADSLLAFGDNEFTITVTPADGTSSARTITLTINRPIPAALPSKLRVGAGKIDDNPTFHWETSTASLVATDPYRVRWRRRAGQGNDANEGSIGRWEPSVEGMPVTGTAVSSANCGNVIDSAVSDCLFEEVLGTDLSEIETDLDFQIRAVGLFGAGPWSDLGLFDTSPPSGDPPAPPADVAAAGGGELLVTWTASTDTHTSNAVRWRTSAIAADAQANPAVVAAPAGDWQGWVEADNPDNSPVVGTSDFGAIADSATSHRILNLTDATAYDIQVHAHNGANVGAWSTQITATPGVDTTDARLSGFGVAGLFNNPEAGRLTPAFNAEITEYTMFGDLGSLNFSPTTMDPNASVAITGGVGTNNERFALGTSSTNEGRRVFVFTVTAADMVTTKVYTIDVTRASRAHSLFVIDANHNRLTISPVLSATGTSRTYHREYTVRSLVTTSSVWIQTDLSFGNYGPLPNGMHNPRGGLPTIGVAGVTALGEVVGRPDLVPLRHTEGFVDGNGDPIRLEDDVAKQVDLQMGLNEVQIRIHATDVTSATPFPHIIPIFITRTAGDSSSTALRSVAPTGDAGTNPALVGGIMADKFEYDIVMTAGTTGETATITMNAVAGDSTATITTGATATINAGAPGIDTHTLTVTAEDSTTQDYTFRLIRTAGLSALTLLNAANDAAINISPSVDDAVFNYTAANVAAEVSSVKVTPTYANSGTSQQWRVNGGGTTDLAASAAANTIPIVPGENTIELLFAGPASNTKDPVIYTIKVTRAQPTPPAAVSPVSGGAGETFLNVNWTQLAENATTYNIRWRDTSITPISWLPNVNGEDVGDVATYRIPNLAHSTTYTYELRAVNQGTNGAWTAVAAPVITISAHPVMFTTTPLTKTTAENAAETITLTAQIAQAPTGDQDITFTTSGTATVTSDYTISTSPITITGGTRTATITITVVNDTSAEVEETLTITLTDGGGYSLASADTTYTLTITDDDLPAKITALGGQPNTSSNTAILIAWEEPDSGLGTTPYDIRWRVKAPLTEWEIESDVMDTSSTFCTNFSITAPCRQATLSSLHAGVTYEFQIRGESAAGFGPWSDVDEETNSGTINATSAEPATITATATTNGATVEWTAPASHGTINDYRIRYRTAAVAADAQATPPVVAAAAGTWQGWIDAPDLDDSPILGDDTNGFGVGSTTPITVTLSDLLGDVVYDVAVAVVVGQNPGPWVATTVTPTAPAAAPEDPAAPTATAVTSTGFTVGWVKVPAATTYFVRHRAVGATAWTPDADGTDAGDVAAHPIAGLTPSTSYNYEIRANNSLGNSPNWVPAAAAQSTLPTADFTTTASSVSEGAGTTTITAELSGAVTTATTITLTAGGTATTTDDYTLAALTIPAGDTTADLTITLVDDTAGESDETLTLTIAAGTGYEPASADIIHTLTITDNDMPEKITETAGGAGGTTAFIWGIWDIPAGTLITDPYEVRYRVKTPLGPWTTKAGADLGVTAAGNSCTGSLASDCVQAQLDGLTGPGATYEFQVRAESTGGKGEWSDLQEQANSGTATTAAVVTDLAGNGVGNGAMLTWTAPSGTIADYRVRYRLTDDDADGTPDDPGAWQGWVNDATEEPTIAPTLGDSDDGFAIGKATTGYTLTDLTADIQYEIEVAAIIGETLGAWASVTVTATLATVAPAAPAAPTADEAEIDGFTVTWQGVSGATEYHVRWRTNPGGAWLPDADGETVSSALSYTITGLTHDTLYDYQVRANNSIGPSAWVSGTPQKTELASSDAEITALSVEISGVAVPMYPEQFSKNIKEYNFGLTSDTTVQTGTHTIRVTPTLPDGATAAGAKDPSATGTTVQSSGTGDTEGNSVIIPLYELGVVEYTLTVLAEDRDSMETYTFNFINGPDITVFEILDATEGSANKGDDIPFDGMFNRNRLDYDLGTVLSEVEAIEIRGTWTTNGPNAKVGIKGQTPQDVMVNTGLAGNTIKLNPGENIIELTFNDNAAGKAKQIYTFTIIREALTSMNEKAEAVAKSVTAAVVLSGVLDAVSQNAFDAAGSFTPFVNLAARAEPDPIQALVPIAPLLLSEQPQRRDADWRDLLGASAFRLNLTAGEAWSNTTDWLGESLGGGEWSVWGSGDVRGFNGGGDIKTEGMGYSGYLGTDYKKGNWLVGIAAGYSTTTADITVDDEKTESEFWLAGGYPYLRYSWQNRVDAWLLLGAGAGEMMLKEEETDATALVLSHLYAAGAKVNVLQYGNLSLSAKIDGAANFALSLNTENLEDFDTMQQRARVALDIAYNYRIATHAIRPHLEVGARLDFGSGGGDRGGGSIEVGDTDLIPGAEVAGGIRYEYLPLRLSVDARGRALIYDTTGLLREWGAGATIRMTPKANGEGISASLTPGWGTPQSRIDNMWQHDTPTLTTNPTQALTLQGELAYTFKHKDTRITPLTQYSLTAQSQTVGIGTRLNLAPLSLELLGERIDHTTNPDNYRLRLNSTFRF